MKDFLSVFMPAIILFSLFSGSAEILIRNLIVDIKVISFNIDPAGNPAAEYYE